MSFPTKKRHLAIAFFCFCVFRALVPSCQRKQSFVAGNPHFAKRVEPNRALFLAFLRRYFRSFLRPARSHAVEKENFFLPHVSICYRMGFSRSSSVKTFLESEEKEVFRISLLCRTTSFSPVFFFEITSLYQRIIRIAIFLFFK